MDVSGHDKQRADKGYEGQVFKKGMRSSLPGSCEGNRQRQGQGKPEFEAVAMPQMGDSQRENADSQQAVEILTTGLRRFPQDANFALRAGWVALLTGNSRLSIASS